MGIGLHTTNFFVLLLTGCWLIGLIHCLANQKLSSKEKIGWVIVLIFTNWIGALLYLAFWFGVTKKQRNQPAPAVQQGESFVQPDERRYEQGYQPVRRQTAQIEPFVSEAQQEELASPLYEQPQVLYPDHPM